LLAPHPSPNMEDHHFLAVRDCLFNIFTASLHTWMQYSLHTTQRRAIPYGTRVYPKVSGLSR